MRVDTLFFFLVGFTIGLIVTVLLTVMPVEPRHTTLRVVRSNKYSVSAVRKIRILCYIPTATKTIGRKDVHAR